MPRIDAETTYRIELSEQEVEDISSGSPVAIDLPDGNTIRLTSGSGDGDSSTTAEPSDSATMDDVKELVEEAQQEAPSPKGSDPDEEDGNPHTGGIIKKGE